MSKITNSRLPVSCGHSVAYAAEEEVQAVVPGDLRSRSTPVQVAGWPGNETSTDSVDEPPAVRSRRVNGARIVRAAGREARIVRVAGDLLASPGQARRNLSGSLRFPAACGWPLTPAGNSRSHRGGWPRPRPCRSSGHICLPSAAECRAGSMPGGWALRRDPAEGCAKTRAS
jgi:hypothetical protein